MHAPEQAVAAGGPVLEAVRLRRSTRHFDPDRPVGRDLLLTMLEAARWAPSSRNEQPWRFLVFDGSDPEVLERARACLNPGNAWARSAPVLVLTVAKLHHDRDGRPNAYAWHDVGLATAQLMLQAVALGLAIHPMAGFDKARAREAFGIPEGYEPVAMVAVGYRGDPARVPPELAEREHAPRTRRPLGEIAFAGTWGKPFAE